MGYSEGKQHQTIQFILESRLVLETRFILFQALIIVPFICGAIASRHVTSLPTLSKKIITLNLVCFEPPIIFWSIWGLKLTLEMAILPVAGLGLTLTGFLLGNQVMRFTDRPQASKKVYVICSSLANHGFTMGGFLCYLFAGERGLALSAIFILYFIPYTFLFIFPYAGIRSKSEIFNRDFIRNYVLTPRNCPIYAVFLALLLKLLGIERPSSYFPLDPLLIISIVLYYLTLGITFKTSDLNPLKREQFLLALQKFLILPAIAFVCLLPFELDPQIKLVILLQSFMPVAVYSVISSVLFDLDTRLASGLFIVNSILFLTIVMPILLAFRGTLLPL